jgi:spore maturation protein CgeB
VISVLPPPARPLRIVILGLSITSSWGNGHATTYRSLMRALTRRGHDVLFLERDMPWYAANRDVLDPPCGAVRLYRSLDELRRRWHGALARADLVMIGSYVPEGIAVVALARALGGGLLAFYDIDTPVTLAGLAAGNCPYLRADLVPVFDLYLSFTGGPVLRHLERHYGARMARVLYCAVDPDCHHPEAAEPLWDLGYLGTYSADRQPKLNALMLEPARRWPKGRFSVAGPLYPPEVAWPPNLERIEHIGPADHHWFYGHQRFTLNVTRTDMVRTGYAPSVRLFEAASCGTPIISDWWPGLDTILSPGSQILVARRAADVLCYLRETGEEERRRIAARARATVLAQHTAAHRALALESYVEELLADAAGRRAAGAR